MKRILFLCNTPFQIMMAVSFRMVMFPNDTVDIVISDLISEADQLQKNIEETKFFDRSYYFCSYTYDYETTNRIQGFKKFLFRRSIVAGLIGEIGKYDVLFTTDSLPSNNVIYELLKRKNPGLKLFFYEEGPISVLCDQGNHFRPTNYYLRGIGRFAKYVLGYRVLDGNYEAAYTSVSEFMEPNYFEWRDIPIIERAHLNEYVGVLNRFWKYEREINLEDKIIFLEESFFQDNRGNKDLEIIGDIIANSHGREVVVKMHPRTRENRFQKMGIKTIRHYGVPWELIALNGDMKDAILISISSGAILYPQLYWGITQKSISLIDCKEYRFDYLNNEYYRVFSNFCGNRKLAHMPNNKREFLTTLEDFCNGAE